VVGTPSGRVEAERTASAHGLDILNVSHSASRGMSPAQAVRDMLGAEVDASGGCRALSSELCALSSELCALSSVL
jgi:hypothetical protein